MSSPSRPFSEPSAPSCGIGISLVVGDDGLVRVKNVQCGSPSHFSGCIAISDEVLSVDSTPITSIAQATELITGPRGTLVRLGLRPRILGRPGEPSTVTLLRTEARPMPAFHEGGAGLVLAESLDGYSTVVEKVVVGGAAWLTDRMRAGDRVTSIDGRDLRGSGTLLDVKSLIRGPAFSRMVVGIERDAPAEAGGGAAAMATAATVPIVRSTTLQGPDAAAASKYKHDLLLAMTEGDPDGVPARHLVRSLGAAPPDSGAGRPARDPSSAGSFPSAAGLLKEIEALGEALREKQAASEHRFLLLQAEADALAQELSALNEIAPLGPTPGDPAQTTA